MISCVAVFDGRKLELFMTIHSSSCSDPAWNLIRPR